MEMRQETKISLAWELMEQGVPKSHIAKHLDLSRRTVIRWSKAFRDHKWYIAQWFSIAQTQFTGIQPSMWADQRAGTKFFIMEHPANHKKGVTGQYFERIGELLAR